MVGGKVNPPPLFQGWSKTTTFGSTDLGWVRPGFEVLGLGLQISGMGFEVLVLGFTVFGRFWGRVSRFWGWASMLGVV